MTKNVKPLISVYMPVYNTAEFLDESIESILNQSYKNIEFIIVDDASTDNSYKIIRQYQKKDPRIKIFRNKVNRGVSYTSNFAISKAKGDFLARLDADDVAFPNRLDKQLKYLLNHKKCVAVGAQCFVIDQNNQIIGTKKFPFNFKILKEMIFWAIPLQQPCVMFAKSRLPKNFVWYDQASRSAEEVDLIFRLMTFGSIANLPDFLLYYRYLSASLSHKNPKSTFFLTIKSRFSALSLGFRPSLKAVILNITQIIVVSLLPTNVINDIWSKIRGIKESSSSVKTSLSFDITKLVG